MQPMKRSGAGFLHIAASFAVMYASAGISGRSSLRHLRRRMSQEHSHISFLVSQPIFEAK